MNDYSLINIPIKVGNFINMQKVDNYKEIDLKIYQ